MLIGIPVYDKVDLMDVAVVDRNRLTGGGISSGLDEALKLVELLTSYQVAQKVQRSIQYCPDPPVASTIPKPDGCPFSW
jgi:cyclohexyl-isocyanide hydratase